MDYDFRWNNYNRSHIAEHHISTEEAEFVVRRAGWRDYRGNGKFLVAGQTPNGLYIQVVYIISPPTKIYVIHARPLSKNEKRRFRRRRK